MKKQLILSGACLLLFGCDTSHQSGPVPQPSLHYVVGSAWHAENRWFYPRETFSYAETGLAVVQPKVKGAPPLTADGEVRSDLTMTAAHQTLQLPAIVTVTNLENGRQAVVRLNDRGPDQAGRLLAVTPRVASVLGIGHEPVRVRIVENETASRELAGQLPGGPALQIAAMPVKEVLQNALDSSEAPHAVGAVSHTAAVNPESRPLTSLPDLPAVWQEGAPAPASDLWVETANFTSRYTAQRAAAGQGALVVPTITPQGQMWSVRLGPFSTIHEADAALRGSLAAGQTGSHIVVE
ncbi:hypothetical protein HK11_04135 [Acetobacter sp. DmW_043]|uniref:septal ring lytic transglycosylase RlpA family protein n=1 Tax=Acetobacter sp. DmW_043 TaxID=1670658 RepID=UPI000B54A540|nr:SPOR domain-containing protein [Acetobacter sp. DmW_043]OUI88853.1 hypothetical protein HK11_04135 [Acetobacter sp. DmW_043]